MKKTLVAVAAFAAVSGAFADVTVGGNLNQAYTTTTVNGASPSKSTTLSAASNSSFITFSGNEDLGSGMKASFKVEPGLSLNSADTIGATSNREAWVGVSGAFGDIRAGHQYSNIFFAIVGTDPNGFNNIVGWGPSTAMLDTANSYALLGSLDTISYTLPSVIEGVGVSFQSLRPTSTTTGTGTSITYTNAGLYAGWANRLSGADKSTAYAVSYDFGAAKVAYSSIDSTIGGAKTTDSTYTISAPVTSAASVGFSSGTYNLDGTKTNNSQLGAYYNLSKRTQAYVIYGKASAASSTTTTAVGVNHAF